MPVNEVEFGGWRVWERQIIFLTLITSLQKMIVKLPSFSATTAAKLQTGIPCSAPFSSTDFPCESYSCHASEPPFFQPVPSVQTSIVSPREFAAITGCLRFPVAPGAGIGETVRCFFGSSDAK